MKKTIFPTVVTNRVLLLSMLMILPSCRVIDWFKEKISDQCTSCNSCTSSSMPMNKELSDEVVVKFGDKVVLTGADFEQNVDLLMQSQAGIKDIIACMSPEQRDQVFENILEGLVNERLISAYIINQGLDKTREYKEQACRAHEAVDRDLAIRAFEREVVKNIAFTDEEANNWYEKNFNDFIGDI